MTVEQGDKYEVENEKGILFLYGPEASYSIRSRDGRIALFEEYEDNSKSFIAKLKPTSEISYSFILNEKEIYRLHFFGQRAAINFKRNL